VHVLAATTIFGIFTVESPLGLGVSIVCAALLAVVMFRHGRRALPVVPVLLAIILAGAVTSNIGMDLASGRAPVCFVIDVSASNRAALDKNWKQVRREIAALSENAAAPSLAVFVDGRVEQVISAASGEALALPDELPAGREPNGSELALAAKAAEPFGAPGRVVLVTDGAAELTAVRAAFPGAKFLLLESGCAAEVADAVRIEQLEAPTRTPVGMPVDARVRLSGVGRATASVTVSRRGEGAAQNVSATAALSGAGSVDVVVTLPSSWFALAGRVELTAVASVAGQVDAIPANNSALAVVDVGAGKPVLYVAGVGVSVPETDPLFEILNSGPWNGVKVAGPDALRDAANLAAYQLVVLNDVPLESLPDGGEAVRVAVERFGVGLVVVGAEHAFGPGGYSQSPLEAALPLDSNPRPDRPRQHVLLLDASASMGSAAAGGTRFGLLQGAAAKYLAALGKEDSAALVPFNGGVVGTPALTKITAESKQQLARALASVVPAGETSVLAALKAAAGMMSVGGGAIDKPDRRVVLVTDGESPGDSAADIVAAVGALRALECRITVILLGEQEPAWLAAVRQQPPAGPGSFDSVRVAEVEKIVRELPRVLTEQDRKLIHAQGNADFQRSAFPHSEPPVAVGAWVGTALKQAGDARQTAEVSDPAVPSHTKFPDTSPLSATWKYGQGTAIALPFACDSLGAELADHVARMIAKVASAVNPDDLRVSIVRERNGPMLRLDWHPAEAVAADGAIPDSASSLAPQHAQFSAIMLDDNGRESGPAMPMERGGTHSWFATMPGGLVSESAVVRVTGHAANGRPLGGTFAVAVPKPAELFPPYDSPAKLREFIRATDGNVLAAGSSMLPEADPGDRKESRRLAWALMSALIVAVGVTIWFRRARV
jgi:hypothetical protein